MKRRTVLAGVGSTTVALSGCLNLGDRDGDDRTDISVDERCEGYVLVSSLPEPTEEEAIAAIEDGEYVTEGDLLLPEVVRVDSTYLVHDDDSDDVRYYEIAVETAGDRTRLHAEETVPETEPVRVRNRTNAELSIDVRLEYEGELLFEATPSIESGQTVALEDDVEYRYGNYRAELTAPDAGLTEEVQTWSVNESRSQVVINVNDGETFLGQNVHETSYCEPAVE